MTSLGILSAVMVVIASCAAVNGALNCSAINDPDVRNFTMRLPVTTVPTTALTTTCLKFLLPNDTVYDIIAIEQVIENADVVDYMELLACVEDPNVFPTNETHTCGFEGNCPNFIGHWEPGTNGQCMSNQYGIRIGPGYFQYAELWVHWINPQLKPNLTDSSGMIIYYTNNTRQYQGGNFQDGQYYLDIPPGQQEVTAVGSCTSGCTKRFPESIYLTSAYLYMQLIGSSGNVTLYRNGSLVQMLHSVSNYDYKMPAHTEFENPIEVKPGDEIRTTCVYNSTNRNTTTYIGQSPSDEACIAVLSYYPLNNGLLYCAQWKNTIDMCGNVDDLLSTLCDTQKFIQYTDNLTSGPCSKDCEMASCGEIMNEIYATGCLNYKDIRSFIRLYIPAFVQVLANCEFANPMSATCSTNQPCTTMQASRSSRITSYNKYIFLGIIALYYTCQQSV